MYLQILKTNACSLLFGLFIVLITAVKISPVMGGITFLVMCLAHASWPYTKRAIEHATTSIIAFDARARRWSGKDDWPETLVASSLLLALGAAVWIGHMIIEDWNGREVIVALLAFLISVALPACKARQSNQVSEGGLDFKQLCETIIFSGVLFYVLGCLAIGYSAAMT